MPQPGQISSAYPSSGGVMQASYPSFTPTYPTYNYGWQQPIPSYWYGR
jgi:hypothetical protein